MLCEKPKAVPSALTSHIQERETKCFASAVGNLSARFLLTQTMSTHLATTEPLGTTLRLNPANLPMFDPFRNGGDSLYMNVIAHSTKPLLAHEPPKIHLLTMEP
jgi:hypothetical protein